MAGASYGSAQFAAPVAEVDKLREALMVVDPDALTPLAALEVLYRLKGMV